MSHTMSPGVSLCLWTSRGDSETFTMHRSSSGPARACVTNGNATSRTTSVQKMWRCSETFCYCKKLQHCLESFRYTHNYCRILFSAQFTTNLQEHIEYVLELSADYLAVIPCFYYFIFLFYFILYCMSLASSILQYVISHVCTTCD